MSYEDQYQRYFDALDGKPLDLGERGDPPSGFYRFAPWKTDADKKQTTIALWRGEAGEIFVEKNFYEPKEMTALEADDLFTNQHVAISQELYESRRTKALADAWPEIHTTYLRTVDIKAGVVWTEEWARKRLSANVETHDERGNPRAVAGDNNPPDATPVEALTARIKAIGSQFAAILKEWGSDEPRTKAEGDLAANFAVKFKELENEAVAAHKIEKAPHLAAGQAVDEKWRAPRDLATKSRARILALCSSFIDKENARQQAEVDAANKAAREAAAREAKATGEAPAPVAETKAEPIKLGNGGRTVSQRVKDAWNVTDYVVFTGYLVQNDAVSPALKEAFDVCATNLGKANIKAPGMAQTEVRKAA